MDKYLSCWNVTGKCYFVVRDVTEEGAIRQIAEHAEKAHGMEFTEELREKARLQMRIAA
ncbi:MAG: DUF1059 domain-containing protein [Thermodesulfobacteriota bacterium]